MPQWMKKSRCRKCTEERAVRFCLRNNKELCWSCCNELRSDEKCPPACVFTPKNVSEKTGIPQLKTDSRTELIDFWGKYLPRWAYKPVLELGGKTAMEVRADASGKEILLKWLSGYGFPDVEIKTAIFKKLELGTVGLWVMDGTRDFESGIANPDTKQIDNLCYEAETYPQLNVEALAAQYLDAVIAQDWQAVISKHTLYQEFVLSNVSENYISVLSRHPLLKKVTQQHIVNAGWSEDKMQAFVLMELNRRENWTMVYILHQHSWHPYQLIWGTIQDYYAQKQHFKEIVAALAAGNLTISWDKLQRLKDLYPLSADLAYYRGLYYKLEHNPAKAKLSFEDAVAFDPTWEQPLHHLALAYMQDKDFESPLPYLNQILKFHPVDLDALNNLGVCYMGLGQQEKAEKIWRQALQLNPDNELLKKNIDRLTHG